MARLTGPLLSMSASGQVGKTLVFGDWKGVKYARQYVVPANPNSGDQQTQRGYLTSALSLWHDTTNALVALDKTNLNRAAGLEASPMSGFNLYVKNYINTRIAGATPNQILGTAEAVKTEGAVQIEATSVASVTTVKMRWGYSPTALVNLVTRDEAAVAGTTHTFILTTPTEGQVVYYQIYDLVADSEVNLGIGRLVVEAA